MTSNSRGAGQLVTPVAQSPGAGLEQPHITVGREHWMSATSPFPSQMGKVDSLAEDKWVTCQCWQEDPHSKPGGNIQGLYFL